MTWISGGSRAGSRRIGLVALTLVLLGAGMLHVLRRYPRQTIAGESWLSVLECDLADGWCPGGWGWGEWTLGKEALTGAAPADSFAVYFFCRPSPGSGYPAAAAPASPIGNSSRPCAPFRHGDDFAMQAEVRLIRPAPDRAAEAQLLIRESNAVRDETGLALVAGRKSAILRYRAGGTDYLLGNWPIAAPVEYGRWYHMTFLSRAGHIRAELDGTPVFDSRADSLPDRLRRWMDSVRVDRPALPPGHFTEPHIAVKNGVAEFRRLRLLVRPRDREAFVQ